MAQFLFKRKKNYKKQSKTARPKMDTVHYFRSGYIFCLHIYFLKVHQNYINYEKALKIEKKTFFSKGAYMGLCKKP